MIRFPPFLVLLFVLGSCTQNTSSDTPSSDTAASEASAVQREQPDSLFQAILDVAELRGSILIYDLAADRYRSNDFDWARKGQLPASTFKIPHSLIALELGVVESDSSMFKWAGEKRAMKRWERDLSFKEAFHLSCVPCYQKIARKIGLWKMVEYMDRFAYGNIQIDSATLDRFWLQGPSIIDAYGQIEFLKRLYQSDLPISEGSERVFKEMFILEEKEGYRLSGKTGWSIQDEQDNGWFVGYLEKGERVYFFASNLEPQTPEARSAFAELRKSVTLQALDLVTAE